MELGVWFDGGAEELDRLKPFGLLRRAVESLDFVGRHWGRPSRRPRTARCLRNRLHSRSARCSPRRLDPSEDGQVIVIWCRMVHRCAFR